MKKILFMIITLTSLSSFGVDSTINGSQKSFNQAFESLTKSDGNASEELDIQIGKQIKTHPVNFLKALKIYRKKINRLDALVGNFGPEFVDHIEAQKKEANSRIASLERAKKMSKDPAIIKLADECIAELRKF